MVLSTLFTIFRTGALIILLNDYVKRNYPERYENLLIEIPLHLIYFYSKCQIMYAKLKKIVKEFIEANPPIQKFINDIYKSKSEIYEIEYVNGEVVSKYKRTQSLPDRTENDGSLVIYSNLGTNDKCLNKKIIPLEINFDYQISKIQFILVELKFESDNDTKSCKIVLKNDTYNYYIIDNILDKKFFVYYLRKYEPSIATNSELNTVKEFIVKIIDHNVNVGLFTITDAQFITIKENDYIYNGTK